ncbi:MAG: hypothetical protein MRJ93_14810 [Nitrososphaeraceae archaeon]|nr:hypothetical protein [Nitrososphaeraceae archaeon]
MNGKIKKCSSFLLAAVLIAGTISMTISSIFAQPYTQDLSKDRYGKDPFVSESYAFDDPKTRDHKDAKNLNVQKINCYNSNVNVNGVDVNHLLDQNEIATTEAQQLDDGKVRNDGGNGLFGGGLNIDKNLANICLNVNFNDQRENENGQTCEGCFTDNLDEQQLENLLKILKFLKIDNGLEGLCQLLTETENGPEETAILFVALKLLKVSTEKTITILKCLENLGIIEIPQEQL